MALKHVAVMPIIFMSLCQKRRLYNIAKNTLCKLFKVYTKNIGYIDVLTILEKKVEKQDD